MKSLKKSNKTVFSRGGFTLSEVLTVVAILGILAAIAIPSVTALINYGKQQNRMNIARTIYLAVQGEMTNRKVEKNLKPTLTGLYYEKTDGIYAALPTVDTDVNNVARKLGENFPTTDTGNEDYVHYISKPAGYTFRNDDSELDAFYTLLDKVILDKDILDGAVLMEYNIETGVVMSIFYSDELDVGGAFRYDASTGDYADVSGRRGMDGGYEYAKTRHQGYYGVNATGELAPADIADIVNIYDGVDKPLLINTVEKQNVLYVELLLVKNFDTGGAETGMPSYTLELVGTDVNCELDFAFELLSGFGSGSLSTSLSNDGSMAYLDNTSDLQVIENGVNIGAYYNRYIWILDYIDGDILTVPENQTTAQPYSVGVVYPDLEPTDVRVMATRDGGASVTSLGEANTHFYRVMSDDKYEVRSARHLNNIRYAQDGDFRQTDHIDMQLTGSEITNFAPIEGFSGTYLAMKDSSSQYQISNLNIAAGAEYTRTGLFADVSGKITGISLFNAKVAAVKGNVGAIAGTLSGTITQSNSYANVSSGTGSNVGGLVGEIKAGGTLEQSFNAGFYNAHTNSKTTKGVGSVTVLGGNGGGLVGLNSGTIRNSFNNARVNIDETEYRDKDGLSHTPQYTGASAGVNLGGIAGRNVGSITSCYATNYVSIDAAASGGIAGVDTGTVKRSCFISNGSGGSGAVSHEDMLLATKDLSGAFSKGKTYTPCDNSYTQYPYPTLNNNNPFGEELLWGWEDILDFEFGAVELLYYERYTNGSFGYSKSATDLLAGSSSSLLVTNDGYMIDFEYMQSLSITIGEKTYTIRDSTPTASTPRWRWSSNTYTQNFANIPIKYTTTLGGETVTRYRLFLENAVLESYAQGGDLISFKVVATGYDDPFIFYFNPLFGNTVKSVNTPSASLPVRSPRHLDNIDKALSSNFTQNMNIEFNGYDKALKAITSSTTMNTIALAGTSKMTFSTAVVTGTFTGTYNGRELYTQSVEARYGLFAAVGAGGKLDNIVLRSSTVSGQSGSSTGGIASENSGSITGCTVTLSTISGTTGSFGGIAGNNQSGAVISGCTVSSAVSGTTGSIGGIAGNNQSGAVISGCTVSSTVSGTTGSIGGIAGNNQSGAVIGSCTVNSATVSGTSNSRNNSIGGAVGDNGGTVVSSGVLYSTVSGVGNNRKIGGIAGDNTGTVKDVFFLSINATTDIPLSGTTVGGIAGNNGGTVTRALYLAPSPSVTNRGVTTIYPIVRTGDAASDSVYMQGSRYSPSQGLTGTWKSVAYNRAVLGESIAVDGGGMGLLTKFADLDWLRYAYETVFANWYQPPSGYPYPVPEGLATPTLWPETDAPTRPDQVDVDDDDWVDTESTSDRGRNVTFLNGDFSDSLAGATIYEAVGAGRRIYIHMSFVPGWSTRPVNNSNPGDSTNITNNNYLMELQEPIWTSNMENYNNYMASDYNGGYNTTLDVINSPYKYAELNADVQGTLYQLCQTTPGAQFYYSFYHASRGANTNKMNFYLTGVGDNDNYANDNNLVLIRPCWSPRVAISSSYNTTAKTGANWGKYSTYWNNAVRNTVKYDTLGDNSGNLTAGSLSYYSDKFSNWPTSSTRRVYLYDVWIGNTSTGNQREVTGYGLTFWSTTSYTASGTVGNAVIPATGITQTQYDNNNWDWLKEAKTNVIGYWGISYGWKQYYGLYEVPEGQTRTEFAYQSKTASATEGNYLDGISFKSPAFLSIDQNIKMDGADVSFVKPEDTMTVELYVTSWGEIAADNIVIKDDFNTYGEYIEYVGNVTVTKDGSTIGGSTVTAPSPGNSNVLTITLPPATKLSVGESLKVTFQIKARKEVKSAVEVSTLLYYFKNQAVVQYKEDKQTNSNGFSGYINNTKQNASEVLQVYIDPVKLSKTVSPSIDGPFTVTLTVEDTLGTGSSIATTGLITDNIPKGFTVISKPSGSAVTTNADGSFRLTIPNVNLGSTKKLVYTYTLQYTGTGYGTVFTSVSANYKYLYGNGEEKLSVMLNFPQALVGIRVKTQADEFTLGATETRLLDITTNDSFNMAMAESNYDVTPELVLLTGSGGGTAFVNSEGNYQISTDLYTAILIKGSNRLQFTAKTGVSGDYELYYQIKLTATKAGAADFELSSQVTKVSVHVLADSVVYFEKCTDGSYGFYGLGLPPICTQLSDTKVISETGYGVLSAMSEKSAQLNSSTPVTAGENINGVYLYRLNTSPVNNLTLQTVSFGTTGSMTPLGKIHPNFAKAVYPSSATDAGNTFYIRTLTQRDNIAALTGGTTELTFTYELGIVPVDNGVAPEDSSTVPEDNGVAAEDSSVVTEDE